MASGTVTVPVAGSRLSGVRSPSTKLDDSSLTAMVSSCCSVSLAVASSRLAYGPLPSTSRSMCNTSKRLNITSRRLDL